MSFPSPASLSPRFALVAVLLALLAPARAAPLEGAALVDALRQGGYVIVMRHPSSPFTAPDKASADPANTAMERQLDDTGKSTAKAMGEAFRALRIPVGRILSSPTYRAREGVRLTGLGQAVLAPQLDEGAQGMQGSAEAERSSWLRTRAAEAPPAGSNTLLVTHTPNIVGAFGEQAKGVAAGEALVFHPEAGRAPDLVARVKIEEWPRLAAAAH